MTARDVLLYVPHGGTVRAELMVSVMATLSDPDSPVAEFRELHAGPVMGMARNAILADWLDDTPYEWLLMVDADMLFTPGTVRKLYAAADPVERPVIGALCWTIVEKGKIPTMYKFDKEEGTGRFGFTSYQDIPADEVLQVGATGAACLLLHRSAILRLEDRNPASRNLWFAELAVDGRLFGEDFSFCIRCNDAKVPVHVCTGARTGHVKSMILGEAGPA